MSVLESRSPATGELVGAVPRTPPDEVPAIVSRVRAAQPAWAALSLAERRACLLRAAARIEADVPRLGARIADEMGKPIREAEGEVRAVADMAAELEEMEAALAPEVHERGRARSTVYRDPFGVVGAIAPWNFPLMMPHWLVLPALMAGNGVVLKPSEETPLTGQAYVDALAPELPDGILVAIHGADEVGKALVASDVDLVAFTGSREAGKHILARAGADLKRVLLELGGKDPLVVLAGADVEEAAKFAARNSFRNAGQVCVSTERIYVDRAIATDFVDALIREAQAFSVGSPRDRKTRVGPMVNARQRAHVLAQVEDAVEHGARVVYRGEAPDAGTFLAPIVLSDVDHSMAIMRDETFGPVACVQIVDGEDEAIAAANDTPYGLGAAVFGPDERAEAVARRLTAGMIGVNRGCGGAFGTPWVGARQSGYGYHSSRDGHRQFAQPRVVTTGA